MQMCFLWEFYNRSSEYLQLSMDKQEHSVGVEEKRNGLTHSNSMIIEIYP